jgi:hypothetical protein
MGENAMPSYLRRRKSRAAVSQEVAVPMMQGQRRQHFRVPWLDGKYLETIAVNPMRDESQVGHK